MKIIADTHTHTVASGHAYSTITENARAARERGEIEPTRYESYKRLYELAKEIKPWELKERGT